jgi:hypothetical protein
MFSDLNITAEETQVGDNLWQQVVAVAELLIDLVKSECHRIPLVLRQIGIADRVCMVSNCTNIAARVDDCLYKRGNVQLSHLHADVFNTAEGGRNLWAHSGSSHRDASPRCADGAILTLRSIDDLASPYWLFQTSR